MLTSFVKFSRHPVLPLLALFAANVVFYISHASAFA
jgi:hypothetical protein